MTPPGSGPSEMCARIREARRRLPLDQRVVLCLRDGEGLTEEAAAVPETSLDSVRVRLHRARMALRERLSAAPSSRSAPR
jgi:RNA polymerase sigma-70 factor (ECF subfamily)